MPFLFWRKNKITMDIREYLKELNAREDSDCWYIVKQETKFENVLGAAKLFSEYLNTNGKSILNYFNEHKNESNKKMNYRILSNAYNYGLLANNVEGAIKYDNAKITNVFKTIEFYKQLAVAQPYYAQIQMSIIKQMQLEKLFVSNKYDNPQKNNSNSQKRNFRLFPVPIVYKILLELKDKYKIDSISKLQFITLVSTIKSYDDVSQAVEFIKETSTSDEFNDSLKELQPKFDNRVLKVIGQLTTISSSKDSISLNETYIDDIRNKTTIFFEEINSYNNITDSEYDSLLTNTVELWDWYIVKEIPLSLKNNEQNRIKTGYNAIYYGAPGTGKSYQVNELIKKVYPDYGSDKDNDYVFRVTLHPEYTYTDFVGQILPSTDMDGKVRYDFTPNVFTLALKSAYENPDKEIYLILEEMSRANVAAVFGDLFQLLDRKKGGASEYSINNTDIAKYVYFDPNHPVFLPSNMIIIGTVNTSDQNVFVMDTAFKRRFNWKYVSTNEGTESKDFINPIIKIDNETSVKWKEFYQTLNEFIVGDLDLSEDKQIGPYFIKFKNADSNEAHKLVRDKLLQYLWEDVNQATYSSSKGLFKDKKEIPGFSTLYEKFDRGEPVFSSDFKDKLGVKSNVAQEID